MTPAFQAYSWGLSIVCALVAIGVLKTRWIGFILGLLLAQGLMAVGGMMLHLTFGPLVNIGGTPTPIVANIIFALIGAFLGAALARAFRRKR